MKRFIGLLLTAIGAVAALWGGFHIATGQSSAQFVITDKLAISALASGLLGAACISVGLLWMRD